MEVDDRTTLRSIVAEVPAQAAPVPVVPEPTPADLSLAPSVGPDPALLAYPYGGRDQAYARSAPMQVEASPARPDSVQRLKAMAFAVAGLGLVSLITTIAMSAMSARTGVQAFAGVVGIVLYIFLAVQVQARKNWARILIGVLAILGFLGNLITLVTTLGLLAALRGMIVNSYVAPIVFGLVLLLVSEVILIVLAVNAFHRDTAAWCAPAPLPPA